MITKPVHHRVRWALAAALCLLAPLAAAQEDTTEKLVDALVNDLGAQRYEDREQAMLVLRHIGEPAREALEAAVERPNEEVQYRAQIILDDLRSGINPEWDAATVLQLRHYERLPLDERLQLLTLLSASLREEFIPFLQQRSRQAGRKETRACYETLQRIVTTPAAARYALQHCEGVKGEFAAGAHAMAHLQLGRPLHAALAYARGAEEPAAQPLVEPLREAVQAADAAQFEAALDHLEKATTALRKAREGDRALGTARALTVAGLQRIAAVLKQRAALYANLDKPEPVEAEEITPHVEVVIGDPELKLYQEVQVNLWHVDRSLRLPVRPPGVRMLELAPMALRYDTAEKQLQAFYKDLPLSPARSFQFEGKEQPLVLYSDDSIYFYTVSARLERPHRLESYEKDYVVRFSLGKLAECEDLRVRINDMAHIRDELTRGVVFDRLPSALRFDVLGSMGPGGKVYRGEFSIPLTEPAIEPLDPDKVEPEEEDDEEDAAPEVTT